MPPKKQNNSNKSKRKNLLSKAAKTAKESVKTPNSIFTVIYNNITALNTSKYFAGIMMLTLNLGSKYITLELSKTQETYLKYTIGRQVLLFSILWMGTRDIVISLVLTAVFVILGNYLLNENSKFSILPKKMDTLKSELDTNGDGVISEKEIDDAIEILRKARKNKDKRNVSLEEKSPELFRENYI